jgi:hypothetical protein
MVPLIVAAVFAADSSIDFRKLSQSHYDQLSQRRFEEFEQKARSGALQMTVDLAIDQERHHLKTLRLMDESLLDISGVFQRLAWLILFGIVAQVYVILRFKATRMSMSTPPNHALQRTRRGRRGCNRCVPWPGSLSLVRYL